MYDKVMDRNFPRILAVSQALNIQAMQWEAYRSLYRLFPVESKFWERFKHYLIEHADACLQEHRFASGEYDWREYTEEVALRIARGKNGVARAAIAGLVEMANDDSLYEPLIESVNQFNIACQMWDDLCDWKEDLLTGIPSLLLVRALPERFVPSIDGELALRVEDFARKIYYEGHAHYVLKLAIEALDKAGELASFKPNLDWRDVIDEKRRDCKALWDDFSRIVSNNVERVRKQAPYDLQLPETNDAWESLTWDALRFLIGQWRRGFGEARHIMYLSRKEGFSAEDECHYGDVFQRALIADALCDADDHLEGKLAPVIEHEVNYLLQRRQPYGVGGWCYFHDVPEIAPDADDLGQVMQVLIRAGRAAEVVKYCEPPLEVLLRDNARADGSIETWIVPSAGRTAHQEKQVEFNLTKWGVGPDNEVMANLLYALTLYNPARFAMVIDKGVSYLEKEQRKDGGWDSRWYHGPYYGTYVCLKLLATAKPDSPAIGRAIDFLRLTQFDDGGWGMSGKSDSLNTALALLCLASIYQIAPDGLHLKCGTKALHYLQEKQGAGGAWQSVPFIRPRLSDSYGSQTVTTLYVLKALIAWLKLAGCESAELPIGQEQFA
jgi:squalene-hopene/tetraprenyl-beta-curcumene cyclase